MPSTEKFLKTYVLPIAGILGLSVFVAVVSQTIATNFLQTNLLSSVAEQSISIQPDKSEVFLADKLIVKSYIESNGDQISFPGKWEIDGSAPGGVVMRGCDDTPECLIYTGQVPGDFTVEVTANGKKGAMRFSVKNSISTNPFTDALPSWAEATVLTLNSRGILKGYENGTFTAADPVTKSQYITLLYRVVSFMNINFDLEAEIAGKNCDLYADVTKEHYAYKTVCLAYYSGWMEKISAPRGYLLPDDPLLREETAQMITNALASGMFQKNDATSSTDIIFSDVDSSNVYANAINNVYSLKIMNGVVEEGSSDYFFKPKMPLNRAQAAVTIYNLM